MMSKKRMPALLSAVLALSLSILQVMPAYAQEANPADQAAEQTAAENDPGSPDTASEAGSAGQTETNIQADQPAASDAASSEAASDPQVQTQGSDQPAETQPDSGQPDQPQTRTINLQAAAADEAGSLQVTLTADFTGVSEVRASVTRKQMGQAEQDSWIPEDVQKGHENALWVYQVSFTDQDGQPVRPDGQIHIEMKDENLSWLKNDGNSSVSVLRIQDGQPAVLADENGAVQKADSSFSASFDTGQDLESFAILQSSPLEAVQEEAVQDDGVPAEQSLDAQVSANVQADMADPTVDGQKVYCYTLIPGVKMSTGGNADATWNGMGVGLVNGAPEAHLVGYGLHDNYLGQPGIEVEYPYQLPDLYPNMKNPGSYPPITAVSSETGEEKTYQFAEPGSGNEYKYGYYTVDWVGLCMSDGANEGHNHYNPYVGVYTPTWHMNGIVYLNQIEFITVSFMIKEPGDARFNYASTIRVDRGLTEADLFERNLVPQMDNEKYPKYKLYNGTAYRLEYWSASPDMTDLSNLDNDTVLTENCAFYADYVPIEGRTLSVTKKVDGFQAQDDQSFTFDLKMDYDNIPYNPSDQTVSDLGLQKVRDGEYEFSLKAGQTIEIGMPQNTRYSLSEPDAHGLGYESRMSLGNSPSSEIRDEELNEDENVTVMNTRLAWTVSFVFQNAGESVWQTLKSIEVPAEVTTEKEIENQAPDLSGKPETVVKDGIVYKLRYWSETEDLSQAGSLDSDKKVADHEVFHAGYVEAPTHKLKVSKLVDGTGYDKTRDFRFEASLQYNGQPFNPADDVLSSLHWEKLSDGHFSFTLKNGESSLISLPENTHIDLKEDDYSSDGFTTYMKVDHQGLPDPYSGDMTSDTELEFTNTKQQWKVRFELQKAGQTDWETIGTGTVPADTGTETDLYSQQPDMSRYPVHQVVDGIAYELKYWSVNPNLDGTTNLRNSTKVSNGEIFYAGYVKVPTHTLTTTKTVAGTGFDSERSYQFEAVLTYEGQPFNPSEEALKAAGWTYVSDGSYTFSLMDKESSSIELPDSAHVVLREDDYSAEGFKTYMSVDDSGVIDPYDGNLTKDTHLDFTNTKQQWPVYFKFQAAGEKDWQLLKTVEVPADTATESGLICYAPDLSSEPETVAKDGNVYVLRYWSRNEELNNLTDLKNLTPVTDGEVFYAGYRQEPTHQLVISKSVSGSGADLGQEWQFEAKLTFNGQPFIPNQNELLMAHWTQKKPGVYTFSLKNTETSAIDLPEGVTIDLAESDYSAQGYQTSLKVNQKEQTPAFTGQLSENTTLAFENKKQQWDVDFMFRNPGESNWTLKKQVEIPAATSVQSDLLSQLPDLAAVPRTVIKDGTVYQLKFWSTDPGLNDLTDFQNQTPLKNGEKFYAGYTEVENHSLTTRKKVTGTGAEPDRRYKFEAVLTYNSQPYSPSADALKAAGWTGTTDGTYTFSLENGEQSVISLPDGTHVDLREDDYSKEGFTTYMSVDGLGVVDPYTGILHKDTGLTFNNSKQQWDVQFMYRGPGETEWTPMLKTPATVPAETGVEADLVSQAPDLSNYQQTVVKDGSVYYLRYWSTNKDLSNPGSLENQTPVTKGEIFYAGYIEAKTWPVTITKKVDGNGADPNRSYVFNVQPKYGGQVFVPSDEALKAAGWTQTSDDYCSFSLKDGESSTIQLPENVRLQITEEDYSDEGFTTSLSVNNKNTQLPYSGLVTKKTDLVFTNHKEAWTVHFMFQNAGETEWKQLAGPVSVPADTAVESDLYGLAPNMEDVPETVVKDGVVWQLHYWSTSPDDLSQTTDLDNGTPVTDGETFYAGYTPAPVHTLKTTKRVTGSGYEPDRSYQFEAVLTYDGKPFSPSADALEAAGWTEKDGTAGSYTFSLKKDESSSIKLPDGVHVDLKEDDYSSEGFSTFMSVEGKGIVDPYSGDLSEDTSLVFTNTKQQWDVKFEFREAGSDTWKLLDTVGVPADTAVESDLYGLAPNMSGYPETVVKDGKAYRLYYWSANPDDLSRTTDLDNSTPVVKGETFYAGYVPVASHTLTIGKTVEGKGFNPDRSYHFAAQFSYEKQPWTPSRTDLEKGRMTDLGNGAFGFELKNGESISLQVPEGTQVSVDEDSYAEAGFETFLNVNGNGQERPYSDQMMRDTDLQFINKKQQWTIEFKLQDPETGLWKSLKSVEVPAATSTESTLVEDGLVPSLAGEKQTVIKDGTVYQLKAWSASQSLDSFSDLNSDQKLTDGEVFYAGYVPVEMKRLKIEKKVTGQIAADQGYQFDLSLSWNGKPYEMSEDQADEKGLVEYEAGKYHFVLKDRDSVDSLSLPKGITAELTENLIHPDYYKTSWDLNGKETDGTGTGKFELDADSTAVCTNVKNCLTVEFYLKGAGLDDFQQVAVVEVPGTEIEQRQLLEEKLVPNLSGLPKYLVKDSVVYELHAWSENDEMTQMTDFNNEAKVYNNEKFFAAYLKVNTYNLGISNWTGGNDSNPDHVFNFTLTLYRDGVPFTEDLFPVANLTDSDFHLFDPDRFDFGPSLVKVKDRDSDSDQPWTGIPGVGDAYKGVSIVNHHDGSYTFSLKNDQFVGQFILPGDMTFTVDEINGSTDGYITSWRIDRLGVAGKEWTSENNTCLEDLSENMMIRFRNDKNKSDQPAKPETPSSGAASKPGGRASWNSNSEEQSTLHEEDRAETTRTASHSGVYLFAASALGAFALMLAFFRKGRKTD